MTALLGLGVMHVAFAVAGAAILLALGLLRPLPLELALAAGPACLVGMLATLLLGILALVAGLDATFPVMLGLALLVTLVAGGAYLRRRRRATPAPAAEPRPAPGRRERLATAAVVAALAVFFLAATPAFTNLPTAWDDAHIWSFKAVALYHFGGLEADVFRNEVQSLSHADYPILQPLLEATTFHAMGVDDTGRFHGELWLVLGLAVWTAGWLMRPHRALLWLPALVALAMLPALRTNVTIGYADATVGVLLGLGALAGARWLERGPPGLMVLAGLFLAAAANTKNEGLAGALVVLAGIGLAALLRREDRGMRALLAGGAVCVAGLAPWRVWTWWHELESDATTPLGTALDPGFLSGRIDRLEYAADEIVRRLGDAGLWLWTPALFLAVALVALFTPARRLAAFYLGSAVALLLVLAWVYWTSPQPLGFHVDTTVDRTVSGAVTIGVLGLMHLCAVLGRDLPGVSRG